MVSKKGLAQIVLLVLFSLASTALSACGQESPAAAGSGAGGVALAPMENMPGEVKNAPATVQEAYAFAAANPEIVKRLPCYCGCGAMGHKSLYACYVAGVEPGGKINYDSHALGCQICVDIAQDAMRLTREGRSVDQIKAYVDQTYAQYGTTNLP